MKLITIVRTIDQDPMKLAADKAAELGTKICTSMRWFEPGYREVDTRDGHTIRIEEPKP